MDEAAQSRLSRSSFTVSPGQELTDEAAARRGPCGHEQLLLQLSSVKQELKLSQDQLQHMNARIAAEALESARAMHAVQAQHEAELQFLKTEFRKESDRRESETNAKNAAEAKTAAEAKAAAEAKSSVSHKGRSKASFESEIIANYSKASAQARAAALALEERSKKFSEFQSMSLSPRAEFARAAPSALLPSSPPSVLDTNKTSAFDFMMPSSPKCISPADAALHAGSREKAADAKAAAVAQGFIQVSTPCFPPHYSRDLRSAGHSCRCAL